MASLERGLRKKLENAVKDARRVAEAGARAALGSLGVGDAEPPRGVDRALRNRLRAHGRQLGDRLNVDDKKGTQTIERLVAEHAYEHWHRLLFARFLAENDLLVEPESGMPLSLPECQELARERKVDWLLLASDFAQRMLPQIFRKGDPLLEVALPPEKRQEIEEILESLPREIFVADDSLGWVYQFWQAERNEEIRRSGEKIGAEELPAATQFFTDDYQVLFLLHNTLGAWWAGKVLTRCPELARSAADEDELRKACALPGVDWSYLRFVRENDTWRPAAGTFEGWPKAAKDITVLDPCMGSGHFLVFALSILAAMRAKEESLSTEEAVFAALGENLFGLEIDPRCAQIAAFNVALCAWRLGSYQNLPRLALACCGTSLRGTAESWTAFARGNSILSATLQKLHDVFDQAPLLGSLIDPAALRDSLLTASFSQVQTLMEQAVGSDASDETSFEIAVASQGALFAAGLLSRTYTLVATNVPYLLKGKQTSVLQAHTSSYCPEGAQDLATVFLERCMRFSEPGGTHATVTPQNWLFLKGYSRFRKRILAEQRVQLLSKIGSGANATASWDVLRTLAIITRARVDDDYCVAGIAATAPDDAGRAATLLTGPVVTTTRAALRKVPDSRFAIVSHPQGHSGEELDLLRRFATPGKGSTTGDSPHYHRFIWELPCLSDGMVPWLDSPDEGVAWSGRSLVLTVPVNDQRLLQENGARIHGQELWAHPGVAVNKMRDLRPFLYSGEVFDDNVGVLCPSDVGLIPALFAYCESGEYAANVREIDQALKVTAATLAKVPFDDQHWRAVARDQYPNGLPKPHSNDPTQWLFNGHPRGSEAPLQVATARLLGYRWPRQTGSEFMDCPALGPDGLESHADDDGIVCLTPARGEAAAEERLRALLAAAYGAEWSPGKQHELLAQVGYAGKSLDDWLRNGFFENHLETFHNRPFVLHVWDGRTDGFNALVNYHRLVAPNGGGRRTLDKLAHTYLGDWIDRQRAEQRQNVEGADGRVAAAEHLKRELEKILEGEPPYDLFVRWKPLDEQPLGWDPDINDGVRLNLRPFMAAKPLQLGGKKRSASACILRVPPNIKWDKDRGKEPNRAKDDYPWFWTWDGQSEDFQGGLEFDGNRWNDLHYTNRLKLEARKRAQKGRP